MNQPYGLTAKNLLTKQVYPPIKQPYDVAGWTYGLLRDVEVVEIGKPLPDGLNLIPVTQPVPYAGTLTGGASSAYVLENGANNNLAVALLQLWNMANVTVRQTDTSFTADGRNVPAGTFVIGTDGSSALHDQVKALVESKGLIAYAISSVPSEVSGLPQLKMPKTAVYARYADLNFSDTSEGWTRIRLDRAGWPYTRVQNADVKAMAPTAYDAVIIPSIAVSTLTSEINGFGAAGTLALKAFVEAGGTLILQGSSARLPIDKGWITGVSVAPRRRRRPPRPCWCPTPWRWLPSKRYSKRLKRRSPTSGREPAPAEIQAANAAAAAAAADVALNCPGSVVRLNVDPTTKVGYGYDAAESVWCESNLFFNVDPAATAVVVASYPDDGRTVLQSGYISGESWIRGKAAIVDAPLGSGHVVMIAPNIVYPRRPPAPTRSSGTPCTLPPGNAMPSEAVGNRQSRNCP